MIRIAIGTLAVMMIAVPVCASVASSPSTHQAPAAVQEPISLSQDEVVALARAQGLVKLSDIAFERGVWTIAGASKAGARMVIQFSSAGDVLTQTS